MPEVLPDGSVIPHYMSAGYSDTSAAPELPFSNIALEAGEVIQIIYPDDPISISQQQTEYVVMVHHRRDNGVLIDVPYRATLAPGFGNAADNVNFILRPSSGQQSSPTGQANSFTDGSQVIVACLNGEINKALIIGGAPNPKAAADPGIAAGNYYTFKYNGTTININKDGELTLLVTGKTQIDGTPDPNITARNTTITLTKDGNITMTAKGGAQIQVQDDGKQIVATAPTIKLGSSSSQSPVPLGDVLAQALTKLVSDPQGIISNQAGFGICAVGPVYVHPAVAALIQIWAQQYIKQVITNILSNTAFTQR